MTRRRLSMTAFLGSAAAGAVITTACGGVFEWADVVSDAFSNPAAWNVVSGGPAPPSVGDTARFHAFDGYAYFHTVGFMANEQSDVVEIVTENVAFYSEPSGERWLYDITTGQGKLFVSSYLYVGYASLPIEIACNELELGSYGVANLSNGSRLATESIEAASFSFDGIEIIASASEFEISGAGPHELTSGGSSFTIRAWGGSSVTLAGQTNLGVTSFADSTSLIDIDASSFFCDDLTIGGGGDFLASGSVHMREAGATMTTMPGASLVVGGSPGNGPGELIADSWAVIETNGPTTVNASGAIRLESGAVFNALDDTVVDGGLLLHVTHEFDGTGAFNWGPGTTTTVTNGGRYDALDEVENTAYAVTIKDGATLALQAGGELTCGDVLIGDDGGALPGTPTQGVITVDGVGTSATIAPSSQIDVGVAGGAGSMLEVTNGGLFDVGAMSPTTVHASGVLSVTAGGVFASLGDLVAEGGAIEVDGGGLLLADGAVLGAHDGGQITIDANQALAISDGSTWTVTSGGTLDFPGELHLDPGGVLHIDGGTAQLGRLDLGGGDLNFVSGLVGIADEFVVASPLAIGAACALDVQNKMVLDTTSHLTIDGATFDSDGLTTLAASTFEVLGGVVDVLGPVHLAGASEVIVESGAVAFGDPSLPHGFYCNGLLDVFDNSVALRDANDAAFDTGAIVLLGAGGEAGELVAANGLTLDFGGNIFGYGVITTPDDLARPFTNNGHISGNSGAEQIAVMGHAKGVGTYDNVNFLGTYAPGFSPAQVVMGSATYSGILEIEIGGLAPGSDHDQLLHVLGDGIATLGGHLEVVLIDGFEAGPSDEFEVIVASQVVGMFDTTKIPAGLTIEYASDRVIIKPGCEGDLTGDGQVSIEDMLVVLGTWGTPAGDVNADGTTDILDLLTLFAAWGPC